MTQKLSLELIEPQDRDVFRESLALIEEKLNTQWELVECDPAQVVLIDTDQLDSKNFHEACKNCVGSVPLAYGHENHLNSHFFLHKPLSLANLAVCLNELSGYLQQRITRCNSQHYFFKQVEHLHPEHGLLGLVLRARNLKQPVKIFHQENTLLTVDGEDGLCFSEACTLGLQYSPLMLTKWLEIPVEHLQLETLNPIEYEKMREEVGLSCYPLKTLVWSLSLLVSHGALLVTIEPSQKFTLSGMPDFALLPHLPCHAQLAYYMREFQSDLMTIVKNTKTPYTRVIDFINACWLIGLLELDDPEFAEPHKAPHIPSFVKEGVG